MFALSCSNFHMQIGYLCMIGNFSCVFYVHLFEEISDVDTSLFMWQARQFNARPEKTFTALFNVSAKKLLPIIVQTNEKCMWIFRFLCRNTFKNMEINIGFLSNILSQSIKSA